MEILFRETFIFFFPIFYVILLKMTLLIFPFIPSLKIVIKKNSLKIIGVFLYLSFYFITLQKVVFYLLASLPFSHTLKLRIDIGTLLSFNIIKSSNVAFVVMLSQSQSTYIVHLLQIILKFALLSWQVPRSSVGRALYRESGPSQDGDPDLGDLPCFFF